MDEATWLDATAQADLVRRGQVSPKELVEAAIDRIEAVKDLGCTVAGEVTAFGLGPLRDLAFPVTSYLAEQFRAAGFMPLGRTNVPELGTTVTTEPLSFPPARNPWDTGHSTGGSSGGSAAAIASGMVAVAHANDGGPYYAPPLPRPLVQEVGADPGRLEQAAP